MRRPSRQQVALGCRWPTGVTDARAGRVVGTEDRRLSGARGQGGPHWVRAATAPGGAPAPRGRLAAGEELGPQVMARRLGRSSPRRPGSRSAEREGHAGSGLHVTRSLPHQGHEEAEGWGLEARQPLGGPQAHSGACRRPSLPSAPLQHPLLRELPVELAQRQELPRAGRSRHRRGQPGSHARHTVDGRGPALKGLRSSSP